MLYPYVFGGMVWKKGKNPKQGNYNQKNQQNTSEIDAKRKNISDVFLDELKWAFSNFNKIPESHRIQLYGNQEYMDQFWAYFTKEHPNLLDTIDKKDLPIYIHALENKWFSLQNIAQNANKLHESFKAEDTEQHVMENCLSELKKFCDDATNAVPSTAFEDFSKIAWFDTRNFTISSTGVLKTIDDLSGLWQKFLEKEGIKLGDSSAEHAQRILTPQYNPTERVMVTVALTKLRKELKGDLRTAFDAKFSLPVHIFHSYQDLLNFRDEWRDFLDDHASEIDESLAKKLDSIIVTNGDIYNELLKSWRKFDDTKWFSEREQYFRRVFNKLATRQLFEEVQKTQETIDHYITEMGNTFKQFPPYVNDILSIYPFNDKIIHTVDTSFHGDWEYIDAQISDLNIQFAAQTTTDLERNELREKIKALKQEKEYRKWQAYILFLRTKDVALADVFDQLVKSKFDFSVLSVDHQQFLVNVLIKNKLEDTIKNKVPELLDVKEEDITQFVHDLFDLKKMDITIPTRDGPVPITFVKKEFLASTHKQLPALKNLEDIENLPLNFVTQLTESNAPFFEDSPIFNSIYTDFVAKNGKFRVNDAYKVRIKKDWKIVEWYLSAYSPIDEQNTKDRDGKELYLYSEPISAPNQERNLVTRPHEESKIGIPVVIKDEEQQLCDIEVLDKKINLNGDAFGALLFGYILGQQSMNTTMSPQKEKELAEKLGKLHVYQEKEEWEEEITESVVELPEAKKEESEQKKFESERQQLKWYWFPEEKYKENSGFVQWSRLFIPFAGSEVPPLETGRAWIQMEITNINTNKWTFTVKFHGWELRLGKSEWASKELPMNISSIQSITSAFGDNIYKLPDMKWMSFEQQMDIVGWSSVGKDLDKNFGLVKLSWSGFSYALGNYSGKEVTHFGLYQPKAIGEAVDEETGKLIVYKIKPNSNGTITVSGDSMNGNEAKNFPARDMDYVSFMLFIKEKWLQPKCKDQLQAINAKVKEDTEIPTTVRGYSINNVISFFKNGVSKIKDGMKKYDDERSEDLTDLLTSQGKLWSTVWWILSPFSRVSSSFETMGMEYYLERDGRIRKKVEKRVKFYEDYDYTKLYNEVIGPMLDWKVEVVPHYKIAAILLVHLKKGKWPYAKNPASTAKGSRVGKLLWKGHQERYLAIREKRIRDLEQNAHIYGGAWADQVKNELVELEMRYLVHVMDARHMWSWDDDKYFFQSKYSKKFCDELEGAYTWFFKQDTVDEWYTKAKDANFEFARVEYFRQLADRPQQAIPYLKVMATKAINDTQWQVFETAVLAGILSGVFLNMTYSSTQSYIQTICRTRGFVPGIFAKDIKQQYKIQRLLDMFSNDGFSKETNYSPNDYSFRDNKWPAKFITEKFISRNDKLGKNGKSNRANLSKFLDLTWWNAEGKTLLDLHSSPNISLSDKALLEEYIKNTNEKDEGLDTEVTRNTSSLTWSILTKSQSVVDKMIKFDKSWFAGKDWDEVQNMKAFSENMKSAIPKDKIGSSETVKFFVGKFFNRFGERGFSWLKMSAFLSRLKWCKLNSSSPEVENILYYSVLWEILNSLAGNDSSPPDELIWALWAWKDFFKTNLDMILQPDVITSCFGWSQYLEEYNKVNPQLKDREQAIPLLDRDENQMLLQSSNQIERKQLATQKRDLMSTRYNYINPNLFATAETLMKKCSWYPNRFKKSYYQDRKPSLKSTAPKLPKATWAKIQNTGTIEQVRQILEGKVIDQENPDDLFMWYWYPDDE